MWGEHPPGGADGDVHGGLTRRSVDGRVVVEWVTRRPLVARGHPTPDGAAGIDLLGVVAVLGRVARDLERALGAAVVCEPARQEDGTVRISWWLPE